MQPPQGEGGAGTSSQRAAGGKEPDNPTRDREKNQSSEASMVAEAQEVGLALRVSARSLSLDPVCSKRHRKDGTRHAGTQKV